MSDAHQHEGHIDFARLMRPVALYLLGRPNERLSSRETFRYGTHGSLAVEIAGDKAGTFFDHENCIGGGLLDLVRYKTGVVNGAGIEWLRDHNFLPKRDNSKPPQRRQIAVYDYVTPKGDLSFQVVRYEPKEFLQRRPDGKGTWIWKLDGIELIPYRLPELLKASSHARIYVVEGEKDVEALRQHGLVATCNPGGAGKWLASMAQYLRDRHVVIIPDRDERGENHVLDVARKSRGIARSIRIVRLPGLKYKGDVSDFLSTGGTAEEIEELAARVTEWSDDVEGAPQSDDLDASLRDPLPDEPEPGQEEPGPLWLDLDDWAETTIPLRPWIAPGFALRGAVTVIAGPGGSGKSLFAVGMAVALALGREYGRFRPVAPCRVLIWNVEDDADEQRRRFSAALREFGSSPAELKGKVIRTGPMGLGTLLTAEDDNANRHSFKPTPAMTALEEAIAAFRPNVAFLDPLVELHDGEENSNPALRAVVAHFRTLAIRYSLAVVLVHHTRKGASGSPADPDGIRGASAIVGAARVALMASTPTEEDAKATGISADQRRHFIRLDDAKSNYSPLLDAQWFEKNIHTLDNGEQVPAAAPWEPPRDLITQEVMAAIETGVRQGSPRGPWSKRLSNEERSVRQLFRAHSITTPNGEARVLAELQRAGFVEAPFKGPDRKSAKGLRSPDGLPEAAWEG
jgi:RecA-family ATPase